MSLNDASMCLITYTCCFRSREKWDSRSSEGNQRETVFSMAFVITSLFSWPRAGVGSLFEKHSSSHFISNLELTCASHCQRVLFFLAGSSIEAYSQVWLKWNLIVWWLLIPGVAARETAQALKTLAQAARGVAASTSDPTAAHAMLDSARDVMEGSAMLIQEAKQALIAPGDAESQQRLAQVRPEFAIVVVIKWTHWQSISWALFSWCKRFYSLGISRTFQSAITMLTIHNTHFCKSCLVAPIVWNLLNLVHREYGRLCWNPSFEL